MLVKDKLHKIINETEDNQKLEVFLCLIESLNTNQNGQLFQSLSKLQKEELNLAYQQSFDDSNLISHESVREDHSKWL